MTTSIEQSVRRYVTFVLAVAAALLALPGASAASPIEQMFPFAGTGFAGTSGDGGRSVAALLTRPTDLSVRPDGTVLIADQGVSAIRSVSPSGIIATIAGPSTPTDLPAPLAIGGSLSSPGGITSTLAGDVLIADTGHHVVQQLRPDGSLHVIAGVGDALAPMGDGGTATSAGLAYPVDIEAQSDGGILVVDQGHQRIRRIAPDGTISTFAGTGASGYAGDGGSAVLAALKNPTAVAVTPTGGVLIADTGNHRLRLVEDGVIRTIAGTGSAGDSGDGDNATSAAIDSPSGVVSTPDGGALVADSGNRKWRRIGVDGSISTVISSLSLVGSGGDSDSASGPWGLAYLPSGTFVFADPPASTVIAYGLVNPLPEGPSLRLTLKKKSRLSRNRPLVLKIRSSKAAKATISIARTGRSKTVRMSRASLRKGTNTIKIPPSRLRRSVGARGVYTLVINAVAKDGARSILRSTMRVR